MNIVSPPRKFELLCTRVTAGKFTAILCAVYRPGSWSLDQEFFEELAAVFDHIATYREPVFIVGDFNVRLDRPDDPYVAQFRTLVGCYGLVLHDTTATHQRGGTLDAVITHATDGLPECVAVLDVGLSDHHMLRWEVDVAVDTPPAVTVSSRPWRRLDIEQLKSELTTSRLPVNRLGCRHRPAGGPVRRRTQPSARSTSARLRIHASSAAVRPLVRQRMSRC